MKDKIGFVKQHDTLLDHLTGSFHPPLTMQRLTFGPLVRETLYYAAALRLPSEISKQTRDLIVSQTIQGPSVPFSVPTY